MMIIFCSKWTSYFSGQRKQACKGHTGRFDDGHEQGEGSKEDQDARKVEPCMITRETFENVGMNREKGDISHEAKPHEYEACEYASQDGRRFPPMTLK